MAFERKPSFQPTWIDRHRLNQKNEYGINFIHFSVKLRNLGLFLFKWESGCDMHDTAKIEL